MPHFGDPIEREPRQKTIGDAFDKYEKTIHNPVGKPSGIIVLV